MKRGFTFVEILVVVTIIAVLTGLAVVGLARSTERLKIRSAARMVVTLARYARSLAASEGREYRLYCDLEEESVWLAAPEESETGVYKFEAVRTSEGRPRKLPVGVGIRSFMGGGEEAGTGVHYIAFGKDGSATRAALYLEGEGENVWTILVIGSTGLVSATDHEATEFPPEYLDVEGMEAGFYRRLQ